MNAGRRVSIVVPAYNAAETIAATLASLVAQTYQNLEVIVVDDGSKDRTGELAKTVCAASPAKLRYVRQENGGQASALNHGWGQSSGEYLGYLSADDVLYPAAIARLVEFLDQNANVGVVYPDYDLIDAASKVIRRVETPEFDVYQLIEHSVCQPGPGALFRRELFDKTGGWRTDLRLTPDFDFWVRGSRFGSMARLPEVLAGFRVHEESQTFAAPSEAKCEELPNVIGGFLKLDAEKKFRHSRAMAWAHVLSARQHLRGGRRLRAFSHVKAALESEPSVGLKVKFWRLLVGGALGQIRYRLTHVTRAPK